MRADLSRLLVDRGRRGNTRLDAGVRRARRERRDVRREGMKGPDRTGWFDEYLAPLRRFLRSCVGRPWDDVYSELRARLRLTRTVDYHVWQHLQWEVAQRVRLVDGQPDFVAVRWAPLYVCPRTGLLRTSPRSPWRRTRTRVPTGVDAGLLRESATTVLARLDGVWYRLHLGRPSAAADTAHVPPATKQLVTQLLGHEVSVTAKEQLGKRSLRDLGLRRPR